jgi:hypothetical protein
MSQYTPFRTVKTNGKKTGQVYIGSPINASYCVVYQSLNTYQLKLETFIILKTVDFVFGVSYLQMTVMLW